MAIASINADGWTAEWSGGTPPTFAPDTAPYYVVVTRAGFDATGAPTTHADLLVVTGRLRQAWPNQATLTPSTVILSDYVYSTDTIASVTNNSLEASPKPIGNWATVDRQVVGNSVTLEWIAGHRDARDGQPIACSIVTVSDGTNTVSATVSSMVVSPRPGDKCPLPVYRATLDITSLNAGEITANVKDYPWFGDASSVLDSSTGTANSRDFCPQTFTKNVALFNNPPLAYVSSTGNDSTGGVSTTAATAKAAPFATMKGALDKLRSTYTYTDGCRIRVMDAMIPADPTFNPTWQSAAALVIERDPDVSRASAVLTFGATNVSMRQTWLHIRDLTLIRAGSFALNVQTGGKLILEDVDLDNASYNAALTSTNSVYIAGGVAITNPASNLINAGAAELRMVRGLTYGASGRTDAVEGWLVLGCDLKGVSFVSGPRSQSGMIVVANKIMSCGGSAGIITIGATADVNGAMLANNLIEWTAVIANPAYRPSADAGTGNITHLLDWHNTWVGFGNTGRGNILYNETAGTLRTHKLCSSVGSIHSQINTKQDLFCGGRGDADASSKVGGWPYNFGVGCRGVVSLFADAGGGSGQFHQEYPGLNASIGTSITVMNDVRFTDNKAVTGAGAGAGGGTYTTEAGSIAHGRIAAGLAVLPKDLAGNDRRNSRTGSAGAYERLDPDPIEGGSSLLLASLQFAASALVTVAGAAALSFAPIGLSSSAKAAVAGAATISTVPFAFEAAGTIGNAPASADAALSLSPLALSATATSSIRGSAAINLTRLAVTSAATAPVTGAAALSFTPVGLLAAGAVDAVPGTGGAAITLHGLSFAASGQVAVQGQAAPSLAPLNLTLAGRVASVGGVNVSLAPLDLVATGRIIGAPLTGDVQISLSPLRLTVAGIVRNPVQARPYDPALVAIHDAFAEPIIFTPVGGTSVGRTGVYSDDAGTSVFDRQVGATRRVTFEIRYTALEARPTNKAVIEHYGRRWSVIEVTDRDDIGAWVLAVEKAV